MKDSLSKISTQMKKGILEMIILSIIEKGDAYSSDILEMLKKNNLLVVEGTIYPLLSRLKKEAFITYFWVESASGPPRKYYKLTPEGKNILTMMKLVWKDLHLATNKIL